MSKDLKEISRGLCLSVYAKTVQAEGIGKAKGVMQQHSDVFGEQKYLKQRE